MEQIAEMICPLVSVPVFTYNSAETIVETLDSINNQSYPNIELIVSDDASTDNTVEIVRDWMDRHKSRFTHTELITVPENKGVTANYNRASKMCKGEWIKEIDGDDCLLPNCIEIYVDYVTTHPETIYLFGKVEVFGENIDVVDRFSNLIFDYSFFALPPEEQYKWLVTRSFQPIASVTSFFNRNKVRELGIVYDTRIPMLEDWPRWILLVEHGVKLNFVDQTIARYRVSGSASICSGTQYSDSFRRSLALMYIYYQYKPAIKYKGLYLATLKYVHSKYIIENNFFWHVLDYLLRKTNRLFRRQDDFY